MTGRIAWLRGLCLLAPVTVAGCSSGKILPDGEIEPPISVDGIRHNPEQYIGDRVRLTAQVAESHGLRMFTVKDDDPVLKEQMLVVTRRPIAVLLGEERTTLQAGDQILISGVIRPGDIAAVEAELGVDLDTKLENQFRGKPLLVASELVLTDETVSDTPDTLTPR